MLAAGNLGLRAYEVLPDRWVLQLRRVYEAPWVSRFQLHQATVVICDVSGEVGIFEIHKRAPVARLQKWMHERPMTDAVLTSVLVTACQGGFVKLWHRTSAFHHLSTFRAHRRAVTRLEYDGRLISTSADGTAKLWNLDTFECQIIVEGKPLVWSFFDSLLVVATQTQVDVFDWVGTVARTLEPLDEVDDDVLDRLRPAPPCVHVRAPTPRASAPVVARRSVIVACPPTVDSPAVRGYFETCRKSAINPGLVAFDCATRLVSTLLHDTVVRLAAVLPALPSAPTKPRLARRPPPKIKRCLLGNSNPPGDGVRRGPKVASTAAYIHLRRALCRARSWRTMPHPLAPRMPRHLQHLPPNTVVAI